MSRLHHKEFVAEVAAHALRVHGGDYPVFTFVLSPWETFPELVLSFWGTTLDGPESDQPEGISVPCPVRAEQWIIRAVELGM